MGMDPFAQVSSAAHSGAYGINNIPEPSLANLRAGNYKKGRCELHGLRIAIETPQGQRRSGKEDGKPWSVICQAHYGYIEKTRGADGDELDVYVGPWPESGMAYVVNQAKPDGSGFDEHKILMAFPDSDSAVTAYRNSYEKPGPTEMGIVPCTIDQLKWWLKFGNHAIPLTSDQLPYDGTATMNDVTWDSTANPVNMTLPQLLYAMRRDDAGDHLLLDAVTQADVLEASDGEAVLDALVVPLNRLERKMGQMQVIMRAASKAVRPSVMQITPPFKQRGTTSVAAIFEMDDGQTVTAYFHNPDATPNKLTPDDEMVSWKWMLNKKDVTIVVAPERGQELNPREVARRIMKLVEANSARFQATNTRRAERMAGIKASKASLAAKQAELDALGTEIATLEEQVEAKRAAPPAVLQTGEITEPDAVVKTPDPVRSGPTEEQAAADAALAMAAQVVADLGGTIIAKRQSGPGTAGAWSYASAVVNGIQIQLAASGGGVVQVNRKPHDPDGVVNTTPDQVRRSILAVAPEPVGAPPVDGNNAEVVAILKSHVPALLVALKVRHPLSGGADEISVNVLEYSDLSINANKAGVSSNIAYANGDNYAMVADIIGAEDAAKIKAIIDEIKSKASELKASGYWKDRPFNKIEKIVLRWSEGSRDTDRELADLNALQGWFLTTYGGMKIDASGSGHSKNSVRITLSNADGETFNIEPRIDVSESPDDFNPYRETVAAYLRRIGYDGETPRKSGVHEMYVDIPLSSGARVPEGGNSDPIMAGVFSALKAAGWSEAGAEFKGSGAVAKKTFRTVNVQQDAFAYLTDGDEYNRTLQFQFMSEGRNVTAADSMLIPNGSPPDVVSRLTAAAIINAEKSINESYGVSRAATAADLEKLKALGFNSQEDYDAHQEVMAASRALAAEQLGATKRWEDARAYLATVIDGKADLADSEVADKLTALYEAHNGDAEFDALFAKAADAYQAFMVDAAKKAMG